MKYCIRVISDDSFLGKYVSKDGTTTNRIENILVIEAFNVLYGVCEHWNKFSDEHYKAIEFIYDEVKKELEDLAKED